MQPINYFLVTSASFAGLILGMMLVKIAPEEQNPLRNYFLLAKKIIMFLIFFFLIFFYIFDRLSLLLAALLAIPALFVEIKSGEDLRKIMEIYAIFGIILFLSSLNQNLLFIMASLIFLYGALASSIAFKKNALNTALSGLTLLIISNALFLLNYHFSSLI